MDITSSRVAGVWSTAGLAEAGIGRRELEAALRGGRLVRIRRGWYREPGAREQVVRAVRAGGVVGCASALAWHGVWVPDSRVLHVRPVRGVDLRLGDGQRCCRGAGATPAPKVPVDPLELAVASAWRCLSREDFVAAVDSMAHLRLATPGDVAALLGARSAAVALARCDVAESGTESLVRQRLRRRGIRVKPQVQVAGVGRVDLLVGERLVIEVDSRAHHTGVENYAKDRQRDLELRALGYLVVRLTWEQVVLDWPAVEQALLTMVRRGDHRWGSRKLQ